MNTHSDKTKENKSQTVTAETSQMQSDVESTFQFVDNRPESVQMQQLQELANNSAQISGIAQLQAMADNHSTQQQEPIQKKENNTGLPDKLKTGTENLSGLSMDDVKVHYNSDKPAQLQAHAYAQGTDIHVASGQKKHLPHEAWHVVQQKQGRVKPTMQMKGKVNVNDDTGLEREADVMGAKAISMNNLRVDNTSNQGITQKKDAPIQFLGKGTELTNEVTLREYGEAKFKELVRDGLIHSKELRRELGGSVRSLSSLGKKTTKNRALRDKAKGFARGKYNQEIDRVSSASDPGDEAMLLAKGLAKVEAHAQSKEFVEAEIDKILIGLVTKAELSKQEIIENAVTAFKSDLSIAGKEKHPKIKDILKKDFSTLRRETKDAAITKIKDEKHPIGEGVDLTAKFKEGLGTNDYEGKAKDLVREKIKAENVGAGMQLIGGIINTAVPFPGTEASLEIELTIPVGGVGLANAYLVLKFGGEASKDEDNTGKQEVGAKAKISFGAKFEVALMLDFSVGVGGFIEAQAQDTGKLMSLMSYGGYRLADGISKKLSSTIWGSGGNTDIPGGKEEEAARWADAVEEDALVDDNFVELGGALEIGAEVNVGIGKLGLGLEIGGGKRYDESTKGRTGLEHNDGKKTFFVNASAEMEPKFEGSGASFGISGSFRRMAEENEYEFVVGAKLSTGLGNSRNEKVDKIIRWISAIAEPAANWASTFTRESQSEVTEKVGAVGQTVDGLVVASLLSEKADAFAEDIVSNMGSEQSSLTDEAEDNLQNNVDLALEATITHDGDGWNISLALKEIKTMSVNVGIVKGTMEKSTRLVEVGTADRGYIKAMGLNKTRTP
jgi:hypothetical protein